MKNIGSFCRSHGLRLNKKLGQHFLIDPGVLDSILLAANIQPEDHILEIGAGIGALTAQLLKKAGKITAIEFDSRFIPLIREYVETAAGTPKSASPFEIINDDALSVPFPKSKYKIVANIPYHITSPLLKHAFLESAMPPTSMTLMMQREVAEKICDTKNNGMLTVLVGLFGRPELVRIVPPDAFLPPPAVHSAILHIDCFNHPIESNETIGEIFRLTKIAFGKKRKILKNSIGKLDGGMEMMAKSRINPMRRPQELSVIEWAELAKQRL